MKNNFTYNKVQTRIVIPKHGFGAIAGAAAEITTNVVLEKETAILTQNAMEILNVVPIIVCDCGGRPWVLELIQIVVSIQVSFLRKNAEIFRKKLNL